jgi:ABC-type sugar transport system ATPase subunit
VVSVALQNISKTFRSERGQTVCALHDINLQVNSGELLVLTGPSGAGKSTLLRIVAGLEQPSSGTVFLDGQPANGTPPDKRDVGMVFQHDALFPHLTIRENLGLGLRLRKFPKAEIESRVEQTAAMLGLQNHLARFPKELSGGERQRAALGRAIVRRPKVFLLDEPLAHVDAATREKLRDEIVRLHRELNATMIYVTHDRAEAAAVATRIAVLEAGQLVNRAL